MDLWRTLRTYLRIKTYWLGRQLELYVFVNFTSSLRVRNIYINLSPCAAFRPPPPLHSRSLPSDPYGHGWDEGQGVARKDALSVRQTWKPAKPTGAGVFKWEGWARQSARGVKKGCTLHRQTVIHRSVSLSVTPTLGSFSLIPGWGWSSGSAFGRQFTLCIINATAANMFHLECHFPNFQSSHLTYRNENGHFSPVIIF